MPRKYLALLICLSLLFAPLAGQGAGLVPHAAAGDASLATFEEHCSAEAATAAGKACPHCVDARDEDCCVAHHGCCLGGAAALPAAVTARAFAPGGALNALQSALRPLARGGAIFRPPRALS